jgi:hypothetical protein
MFGPLKTLLFLAVLWLPLSFFVWFYFAQLWVQPIAALAGQVMGWLFDASFLRTELTEYKIDFFFRVQPEGLRPVELAFDVNPMIYGFCLPVLVGLVMATPLKNRQRALQIGVGIVVLIGVQVFGTVFDALVSMGIKPPTKLAMLAGSPEAAAMLAPYLDHVKAMTIATVPANVIAFAYQFGYLVLPAISPVILWMAFNQAFIKSLVTAEGSDIPEPGTETEKSRSNAADSDHGGRH